MNGRDKVRLAAAIIAAVVGAFVGGMWFNSLYGTDEGHSFDRGKLVMFDLYKTPAETPAPAKFVATVGLLPSECQYMAVAATGETRFNMIVCRPGGKVNPCGPNGVAPDEFGAVADLLPESDEAKP